MYDRELYPQVAAEGRADFRPVADTIGDWKRRNRQNTSGFFGHTNMIPPKIYGQEHPDWFAEIDGKRQVDAREWKLCHSNTAMVQQATLDVLKDIRKRKADKKVRVDDGFKHLQADYFIISISPTDGGGFCRSPSVSRWDPFRIACKSLPTRLPGRAPGVPRLLGRLLWSVFGSPDAADRPGRAGSPGVSDNYTRSFFYDLMATANVSFREKLEAWMPTCPHRATADFDGIPEWWGFGPLSYVEVHKVDYPWYQQHGIRGISTHASMGWASTGYTSYITSKMWWHPDADVDALRDFVKSAYSEAFEPMWRYHERLDQTRVYPSPKTRYAMPRSGRSR